MQAHLRRRKAEAMEATAKLINSESEIVLPTSFKCPICGAAIQVDEVSEWEKDDSGEWKAECVKIDCVTFPGYDDRGKFDDYMRSHWSMPYVDWLPIELEVTEWVNENYSWEL